MDMDSCIRTISKIRLKRSWSWYLCRTIDDHGTFIKQKASDIFFLILAYRPKCQF